MIDTVVLKLNNNQFILRDNNEFDGETIQQERRFVMSSKYCERYAKEQKNKGNYFPKIILPKRKQDETLEIQVSLPKLIYGTNLFEVSGENKIDIYKNILTDLDKVGVYVSINDLKKAVVKKVDFSKNIELPDYFGTAKQAAIKFLVLIISKDLILL